MRKNNICLLFLLLLLIFSSCARQPSVVEEETSSSDFPISQTGTVPTAECLVPVADGIITYGNSCVTIDASHSEDGYIMVIYHGEKENTKLQITGPKGITYTYNINQSYQVFPLTQTDGVYKLGVYEHIESNQYATVYEENINISAIDEFLPYLYPNQYVNFSKDSDAVLLADSLCQETQNEIDIITLLYNYITSNIAYDHDKATNVQSGYLPDIDEVLKSKKGICFDYAALLTAMLRSRGIPTRLEIGYAGEAYHAWISTYIKEKGWVNGIIEFDGESWTLMDPTFAANSSEDELREFIGNADNYTTKYVY